MPKEERAQCISTWSVSESFKKSDIPFCLWDLVHTWPVGRYWSIVL